MLFIIEHEDGKVGLLPVMSSLGIVSCEADNVFMHTTIGKESQRKVCMNKKKCVPKKTLPWKSI